MVVEKIKAEVTYLDCVEMWNTQLHEYEIELKYKKQSMKFKFYQGLAYTKDPTVRDALSALFADHDSISGTNGFAEWCYALGYNEDSLKDLKVYKACIKNSTKLQTLLGDDFNQCALEVQDD